MSELSRNLDLFRDLCPQELRRIEALSETRTHKPGDVIMRQGFPADAIYLIDHGAVRVTAILAENDADTARSDEEVLVQLGAGEFFGEISFITGKPPGLSVIAEQETQVTVLPHAPLHALLAEDAAICKKLLFAITRTLVGRLGSTGRELVLARYFIRTS